MSNEETWRVNAPDVISETIDSETIILHLGNGFYFSVGGSGPVAWQMLSESATMAQTVAAIESRYETSGIDLESHLDRFVGKLTAEGLLVPAVATGAESSAATMPVDTGSRLPFESPTLAKFTDMEDLLLLDPVHEVSPDQGWPHPAVPAQGA
jgi:hypothetical protein